MIASYWFAGREEAARYIQGPGKEHGRPIPGTEGRAKLIGSEGFEFTVRTKADVRLAMDIMEKDTRLQASRTYPIQHPTMHMVLSWHPGYRPSREEIIEADRHFAQAIGMEGARRITWSHEEKDHFHTHALWGQVNPDTGYAYDQRERHERLARAGILWERERDQITPSRQWDHDAATAAERLDHNHLLGLLGGKDAPVSRNRLDRAISLGGHFGRDRAAQRAEFIDHNGLTRFPANRGYSYSSREMAAEKTEYIRENRKPVRNLFKAQDREQKERWQGVRNLFWEHKMQEACEKGSHEEYFKNPPHCDDCNKNLHNSKEFDFMVKDEVWREATGGKQVRFLCVDDIEKRVGRQLNKDDFTDAPITQDQSWKSAKLNDRLGRGAQETGPPVSRETEEPKAVGVTNDFLDWPWKKTGVKKLADKVQDWRDERRYRGVEVQRHHGTTVYPDWMNKKEIERYNEYEKRSAAKPREQVVIGYRNGFPMTMDKEEKDRRADIWREAHEQNSPGMRGMRFETETGRAQAEDQRLKNWRMQRERNGNPTKAGETPPWRKEEQPQHQQEPKNMDEHWRRVTKEHEQDVENWRPQIEKHWRRLEKETRTPQQIEQDEHGMVGKKIPDTSQEIENRQRQRAADFRDEERREDWVPPRLRKLHNQNDIARDQSRSDGTAGQGRQDRTEAGQPGLLPGGSHELGSPSKQFRDELTESLRKIKPRQQAPEKDQERER